MTEPTFSWHALAVLGAILLAAVVLICVGWNLARAIKEWRDE